MPYFLIALALWLVSGLIYLSGLPAPRIMLTFAALGASLILFVMGSSLWQLLKRNKIGYATALPE